MGINSLVALDEFGHGEFEVETPENDEIHVCNCANLTQNCDCPCRCCNGTCLCDSDDYVICKFCEENVNPLTAHLHQDGWVGDSCCWDERLRASE